ncbi:hypothetical protein [Streptomyces sp. NPDC097619]|uniref:hypothetical protein n=1 Tax=Streptomyces sp. NPDC097619 TaxID=3157228 RepID=UPI00332C6073
MAELLTREVVEVPVEFSAFALQEENDTEVPAPFPEGRDTGSGQALLTAHDRRIDFASAAHTHDATLTAEVWNGEPPTDAGQPWEAQGEAEILSDSGVLSVESMSGTGDGRIELGQPDTLWKVRAYSSGRAAVARLAQVDVPEGVERYLVQFWPST